MRENGRFAQHRCEVSGSAAVPCSLMCRSRSGSRQVIPWARILADQGLIGSIPPFASSTPQKGDLQFRPRNFLLASLLQAFYGIRSERLLLEQLHYNLLYRWFVSLSSNDPIWHPTTFTTNRERNLNDR